MTSGCRRSPPHLAISPRRWHRRGLTRRLHDASFTRRGTPQPEPPTVRDVFREFERRRQILEEHFLCRQVAHDAALSKEHPTLWHQLETGRRARNREKAALNRRLRAEGLRPVELELSPAQRVKKLQQLEARNKAESAERTTRS